MNYVYKRYCVRHLQIKKFYAKCIVRQLDVLFSPLQLRGKTLKNRILSTDHMAVMLDDSKATNQMSAYSGAKAQGGAALTIIEAARVHVFGESGGSAIRSL